MLINNLKRIILNSTCIICNDRNFAEKINFICRRCLNIFQVTLAKRCNICGHPNYNYNNCPSCGKLNKIYYDSYDFIQYYNDFNKKLISLWKYEENFLINKLFYKILIEKKVINKNYYITVVPDNFFKKIKRGRSSLYNLLKMFKLEGYKTLSNIYKRRVFVLKNQKDKNNYQRINHIEYLYYLPKRNYDKFAGKIYLIDDIYTTGSTLNYGAKLLKEAGFKEVHIISFFRAILTEF